MREGAAGDGIEPERTLSLTQGGPFYRLSTRLHLRTASSARRSWWLAFLVWAPLGITGTVHALLGMPVDPVVRDLSLHVRLLFTLPVLLSTELVLERSGRSAMASMYSGRFCDRAELDRIVDRAHRLRDVWWVEAILLGVAVLGGQLTLWGVVSATGVFSGGTTRGMWTVPQAWYATLALPLVQFVMLRWLWRWLIWTYVLARLSRVPLTPLATHADGAGGLAALQRPASGFSGFVLACSALLAAAWGTKVLAGHVTLQGLLPSLVTFLVLSLALAVGPLLLLSGHLFRERRTSLARYGDFMRDYTLRFHAKWIAPDSPPPAKSKNPLGSPDIQSLADLATSYEVIQKTRLFVFGTRTVFMVWSAGILPMVPLFASALTVETVLKRIVTTVLGGLPF